MASRSNESVGGAGGGSKKRSWTSAGNSSTPAATATGTLSTVDATIESAPSTMTDVDGDVSGQSMAPASGEVVGVSDVSELVNLPGGADSTTLPSTAAAAAGASTIPAVIQSSTHLLVAPNARGKQRKVAAHATAADTATAATAHTDEESASLITDSATTINPPGTSASAGPIMSGSFATTPSSTSSSPIPVTVLMPKLPGGLKAGFVTQWYWDHHPHARQLFQYKPHLLPAWSPVFEKENEAIKDIITTVQNVEQAISGRNVIGEIDGKILKEVSPEQLATLSEVESAALLTGEGGKKYQVQLQNKDDARILFNSSDDGGLFRRLGLCPLLCDVFYLQTGGKRTLIGGAGGSRGNPFGHGKLMTKQTLKGVQPQCICTHFETSVNNVAVKEESVPIALASPTKMELDVPAAALTTPTPTTRRLAASVAAAVDLSDQPFVSSSIPSGAPDQEDTEMSDSLAPEHLQQPSSGGSTTTRPPSPTRPPGSATYDQLLATVQRLQATVTQLQTELDGSRQKQPAAKRLSNESNKSDDSSAASDTQCVTVKYHSGAFFSGVLVKRVVEDHTLYYVFTVAHGLFDFSQQPMVPYHPITLWFDERGPMKQQQPMVWTKCYHSATQYQRHYGESLGSFIGYDAAVFELDPNQLSKEIKSHALELFDFQKGKMPVPRAAGRGMYSDATVSDHPIEFHIDCRYGGFDLIGSFAILQNYQSKVGLSGSGLMDKKKRVWGVVSGNVGLWTSMTKQLDRSDHGSVVLISQHLKLLDRTVDYVEAYDTNYKTVQLTTTTTTTTTTAAAAASSTTNK